MKTKQWVFTLKLSLALIMVSGFLGAFFKLGSVLSPFILAPFLAYLLNPLVEKLVAIRAKGKHLSRGGAILVIYLVFFMVIGFGGRYVIPRLVLESKNLVREIPSIWVKLQDNWIQPVSQGYEEWVTQFDSDGNPEEKGPQPGKPVGKEGKQPIQFPPDSIGYVVENYTFTVRRQENNRFEVIPRRKFTAQLNPGEDRPLGGALFQVRSTIEDNLLDILLVAQKQAAVVVHWVFQLFLVMMVAAFLMLNPERIHLFLKSLLPAPYRPQYHKWVELLDGGLNGVVRGQITIALINGGLTGLGLFILDFPYVLILTLTATVFSFIPIFGVLISSVPIVLVGLTMSVSTALLAVAWIGVIHFLEGNFLNPKILGESARIHPALIVFSLVVGQAVAGVMGALLAVPIFSLIQSSFMFFLGMANRVESESAIKES
ncbi:MAG: AI-2E family transporter [Deltaproteobacteria bacterium]|nr:AI-2E family transporter [Deltaproteobacteria bacterium]